MIITNANIKMQTLKPYQSVLVTERHTLDTIKSIINLKKPVMLVLKSENPSLNNHVINYSHQLITYYKWEWMKEHTEIITKYVYDKRKNKKIAIRTISVTLKSPQELQNETENSSSAVNSPDSQKTESNL